MLLPKYPNCAMLLLTWLLFLVGLSHAHQLVPKVVVVTTFPPEFVRWKERLQLKEELQFPGGAGSKVLCWNSELEVLGMVTGETSKHAAQSVTALGYDQRFDLRKSAWLLAGIAGVDPLVGTVGSVTWGQRLVDGTAVKFIDPREMPKAWPSGWLPLHRNEPYGLPLPSPAEQSTMVVELNSRLVQWAYELTQSMKLPDSEDFQELRLRYNTSAARAPPKVMLGDTLSTDVFWTGSESAGWARNWTKYWLPAGNSRSEGRLSTSAMEDFAVAEALVGLQRTGRSFAGSNALLVLRSASNFIEPPPGQKPVAELAFGLDTACEAAYVVGEVVVKELVRRADLQVLYG